MDELIDALRKCGVECKCYGCPYEHKTGVNEKFKCIHMVLSDAADAIERLQAQVPRWIPVTERLPELTEQIESDDYCVNYSKDVLIWSPMNMVPLFEIARYTDDRGWTDPFFTRIKFQETVTHWMPLPEPPVLT